MRFTSYSSSIGSLSAHLCFMPKYRHGIFQHKEVKDFCGEVFYRTAEEYGFVIEELGFDIDHVHLTVNLTNKYSACQIARLLKGVSARKLFQKFPWLKAKYFWGGHLWSPAYFFDSIGEVSKETINNYVRRQAVKGEQLRLSHYMPPTSVGGV